MDDSELKRHFDDLRRHYDVGREHTDKQVDLLAELIASVREELRRGLKELDSKIDQTAAETQAMIKFSHKELDRRITALEEDHHTLAKTVAALQTQFKRFSKSPRTKTARH
jgi:uncharacterized membrane protein YgaE (UPF0421/DUF939 family)